MVVIDIVDCDDDEEEKEEKEEEEEEEDEEEKEAEEEDAVVVDVLVDPLCDRFLPIAVVVDADVAAGADVAADAADADAAPSCRWFVRASCGACCCWVVISLINCRQFSKPIVRSILHWPM